MAGPIPGWRLWDVAVGARWLRGLLLRWGTLNWFWFSLVKEGLRGHIQMVLF